MMNAGFHGSARAGYRCGSNQCEWNSGCLLFDEIPELVFGPQQDGNMRSLILMCVCVGQTDVERVSVSVSVSCLSRLLRSCVNSSTT